MSNTRRYRITRQQDFQYTYKRGKRRSGRFYRIFITKNGQTYARLGTSVSKAVGKAVRRNYEKRIIREFFRINEIHFKGLDIIIQRKPGLTPEFHKQMHELYQLLVQL